MKMIKLTQGKTTVVDDEDFVKFGHLKWHYSHGRAMRRDGYKKKINYWLHREIMGNPEGLVVDHINGNPLDNRKSNLRICTQSQNARNVSKTIRKTSSIYKGVYYAERNKNKWQAYIGGQNKTKRINLGSFKTEKEAALAYNKAALEIYGEFANINIIKVERRLLS